MEKELQITFTKKLFFDQMTMVALNKANSKAKIVS